MSCVAVFAVVVVVLAVVVLLAVSPMTAQKVSFENGTYGMLFESDIEVFGCRNYTDFSVTIVKTPYKLYIDGIMGQTYPRENNPDLFDCCLTG